MTVDAVPRNKDFEADNMKKTMGDADGPDVFVASLGREVPTYIDPRVDLILNKRTAAVFKRLDYHIPFKMRGNYKPEWLPHEYAEHMGKAGEIRVNMQGFVLCSSRTKGTGELCGSLAVNRTNVCRNHGGALHPADKKLSAENILECPPDRVDNLDRVQRFSQGFLKIEDLTDEEITGGYVMMDDGRPINSAKLGIKIQQNLVRELHRRMNSFMQMKLPTMLKRVADIAESDIAEPETSLKAAIWLSERQMGKTPEVIISHVTGAPYETLLDRVESGSREDYRKSIESSRVFDGSTESEQRAISNGSGTPGVYSENGEPLDVFEVDDGEEDPEVDESFLLGNVAGSESVGFEGNDVRVHGFLNDGRSDNGGPSSRDQDTGSALSAAEALEAKAKKAKEIIAARKKAQRRRFAARATGATTTQDMWWLPHFKKNMIYRSGKFVQEGWRCLLVCPDDQSERMLAKIEADANEST